MDHLFADGRGPHSVLISPYDPEHNVWVVDDIHHQIWKFTNDGKKLLMTLGERDEPGMDNQTTELPPGDVMAFKSRAHWENGSLHLHNKQGMNWGRDVLTISGTTLTVVRDLESGGGSSTRTLKYSKVG